MKSVLDRLAEIAVWLPPAIPAYFGAYNAWTYLIKGHNWWDALAVVIIALVIETVGLVSVHTAIQFWTWNRTKNKTDDEAPIRWAAISIVMYVVIIVLVNALLDLSAAIWPVLLPWMEITVKALLSLLSLNSAFIFALRVAHSGRIAKAKALKVRRSEAAKEARKKAKVTAKSIQKIPDDLEKVSHDLAETFVAYKKDWRRLSQAEKLSIKTMTEKEVAVAFQLSDKTAGNWKKYAEAL